MTGAQLDALRVLAGAHGKTVHSWKRASRPAEDLRRPMVNYRAAESLRELGYARCSLSWGGTHYLFSVTPAGEVALAEADA